MTLTVRENRHFYKTAVMIAIPIVFQNLISVGLNLIDTLMIGRVGVPELAAVGAANQVYFIFTTVCFGIYSGAAVYISQYWGVQDIPSIRKVFGIDLTVGTISALLFTGAAIFLGPWIFLLFTRDSQVIDLGLQYILIAAISYVFSALSFSVSFNSRCIQNLKVPTTISAIALVINTILNYLLIYGKLGCPELGVRGAAIATLTARVLECAAMFLFVYRSPFHPLAGTRNELFSWDRVLFKKVMRTAVPVVVSEGGWSLGTSSFFMIYGILGSSALAVTQVASVINELFQSIFFGIGNAASVMIGNELGRENKDSAWHYSVRFMLISLAADVLVMTGLILCRGLLIRLYDFDPQTSEMLMSTILVYALFIPPKMVSYMLQCGILRAGGDTAFCMFVELGGTWLTGIPLALVAVVLLHLPLYLAVGMVSLHELLKAALCLWRYFKRGWLRVLIH